jgi:hypothetical protein
MPAQSNDILIEIRDLVKGWMEDVSGLDGAYGNGVYLAGNPIDDPTLTYAVQIIPRQHQARHPTSGVGLIAVSVDVVAWWRLATDSAGRSTNMLGATDGILHFVEQLRSTLVNAKTDSMSSRMELRSQGSPVKVADSDGWMTITDSYSYLYEIAWA